MLLVDTSVWIEVFKKESRVELEGMREAGEAIPEPTAVAEDEILRDI